LLHLLAHDDLPRIRLTTEPPGRRGILSAIAAVNIGVAVETTPAHRAELRGAARSAFGQTRKLYRVSAGCMAILAQERRTRLEQTGDRRAMRLVANGAVFSHRLVVVHEGPALLHVALVAGLDNAVPFHLLRIVSMHVMTVGATHLAFQDRMAIGLVDLNALLLVAGEADFGLRELVAHAVVRGVQLVT